jgi:hypothetical protein
MLMMTSLSVLHASFTTWVHFHSITKLVGDGRSVEKERGRERSLLEIQWEEHIQFAVNAQSQFWTDQCHTSWVENAQNVPLQKDKIWLFDSFSRELEKIWVMARIIELGFRGGFILRE